MSQPLEAMAERLGLQEYQEQVAPAGLSLAVLVEQA
jgi:hypothetical protein